MACKKDNVTKMKVSTCTSGVTIIDTAGFESLTFVSAVINTTAYALSHGDDSGLSDAAAVTSDFYIGKVAYTATGMGKVGYNGKKRYVQITVTNPATDASIFAIQESPTKAPTAD